jgi:hypothetical protein
MVEADPGALSSGGSTLQNAAADANGISQSLTTASSSMLGACGPSPVGPAVERFAAAWGGELIAWAFGSATLSKIAGENGRQMIAATGG